jgi:hypothetical protein
MNSDGHQFHQYQQNEQLPLILTELNRIRGEMVSMLVSNAVDRGFEPIIKLVFVDLNLFYCS